ncbi:MAG: hypothetical protein LBU65_04140 [Planctomycetaceae bacterium]|jgi:hypothetical protein|nr:hypothetical protein [Planctomycetaceae bacterium]
MFPLNLDTLTIFPDEYNDLFSFAGVHHRRNVVSGKVYNYSSNNVSFSAPNFSVSMYDEDYNGEHYESNDVWHNGRGYYYYYYGNGYSYSGSAPTSHVPNGNVPNSPATDGTKSMPIVLLVYVGEPNFNNYANINPNAILNEKCTPPPVPEPPAPATPQELPAPPETSQPQKSKFDKRCDWVNNKINGWFFRTTTNPNNEKFKQIRERNDMANEVAGQSVHPDRGT